MSKKGTASVSVLDRLICALAPESEHKRLVYKELAARQIAAMGSRSYDIARTGRSTEGWRATGASASSEIATALPLARARARDLIRNNVYADSALSKLHKKIVGTGINPRLEQTEKAARRKIMALWESFSENCDPQGLQDYAGLQSLVARTVAESGEAIIKYEPRDSKFGLTVPLQMKVLEPDYLDHTKNVVLGDGNKVIQGVEFDQYGRRVAYWLFENHPGDGLVSAPYRMQSQRISSENIDHVFDILRPGQVRGITWFASAGLKLRDIGDYEEAELVRKKIESCTVAFVTQTGTPASLAQKTATEESSGRLIEQMAPGMILYGRPGEGVDFNNPSSMQGVTEHIVQQLQAVAAGVGEPYHMMSGDTSKANYSSLRAALLDFWDLLDHWQHIMMVPMMCRKTWNRFEKYCQASGLDRGAESKVLWTPPMRQLVDPIKDAEGEKLQLRLGRKTWRNSVAETGYDPDDIAQEHAETNAKLDDLGLIFDGDPRRVQASGKTQTDNSQA